MRPSLFCLLCGPKGVSRLLLLTSFSLCCWQVHSWARLLDEGTAAPDFVYARGGLAEQAEALLAQNPTPAEAALLRLLTGDASAIGQHEPVNWVEHLLCTLLYGRRGDGSCFSPIYDKELVGETLAEGSMDAVERSAESGTHTHFHR